ncbi:aldose epimerase family protein [Thermophagus sp. OGC60D27]|uniref:aldose epimerase family protein n=1 Tax=Thermophagus sp. OGC60D27 TaxID=3458415 RepID=UPI0040379866
MKKKQLLISAGFILTLGFFSCEAPLKPGIEQNKWGNLPNGEPVNLYKLTSTTGLEVKITDFGGVITSIKTPDKNGIKKNVVLGFDSIDPYLKGRNFFGALIGRYGNRIAKGQFTLNDSTYQLSTNDGVNHLHGGTNGFDQKLWDAEPIHDPVAPALKLSYFSKDGEEGYPGNLKVTVIYTLKADSLFIEYSAKSDKSTPVNLTNHAFYNLGGEGLILDHILTINADHYTPVDSTLIPTGEIKPVSDTPFDFTIPYEIGARIDQVSGGYDHNFVLNNSENEGLNFAARLVDPQSGRFMEIYTEEPGLQFYSGNFLDGSIQSGDFVFSQYSALCLETQHFPDSPNHDNFPSTILNPGENYNTKTVMVFGVEK